MKWNSRRGDSARQTALSSDGAHTEARGSESSRVVCVLRAALPALARALIGVMIVHPPARIASELMPGFIHVFLPALAVGALSSALSGRARRVLVWALGSAAAVAGGIITDTMPALRIPAALLCGAALIVSAYLCMPSRSATQPAKLMLWGVGAHIAGYIAAYFMGNEALTGQILIVTSAMLLIFMLLMNQDALRTGMASRDGARVPGRLLSGNRALMLLFALIALIIYHIDTVRRAVSAATSAIMLIIGRALLFLANLFPASSEMGGGGGGEMGMLPMDASSERGLIAIILEYVAYALGALITLALLIGALYLIGRGLRRLYRRLSAALRNLSQALSEDYQEQRERLAAPGDMLASLGESLRRRAKALTTREKRWAQMNNRERARYLVRRMYKRALPDDPQLVFRSVREGARELLPKRSLAKEGRDMPDTWVAAYEAARYSDQEISDAMVETIRGAESGVST